MFEQGEGRQQLERLAIETDQARGTLGIMACLCLRKKPLTAFGD
jgi:hypothetical protein